MNPLLQKLRASEYIDSPELELRWLQEKFADANELSAAIDRRLRGEPLAYILEEWEFYGLPFKVSPAVLIPRPETELLVDIGLQFLKTNPSVRRILDLGAGSGCIGLSLLARHHGLQLVAVEKSAAAVELAAVNAAALAVEKRAQFECSDVLRWKSAAKFDLILANPPYIAPGDTEIDAVALSYEPQSALYAEGDGLACIESWSRVALEHLQPQGMMAFEIGYTQGEKAKQIFEALGGLTEVTIHKDLSGHDRVVVGRKS